MRAYDPVRWKADDTGSEPGHWVFNDDGAEVPDALRFWREDLAANDDYAMQWIWDEPHCGLRPPSSRRASGRPSPVQAAP